VDIAGVAVHPDEPWMQQIARNVTMEGCGALRDCRYLSCMIATRSTFALNGVREPDTIGPIELLYSSRASTVMPVSYFGWR